METLIKEVATKAGITEEEAKKAITIVADLIKTKTPYIFHEQLDVLLNGGTLSDGFRKKFESLKVDMEEAAKNIGQKAEEIVQDVGKKFNEMFNKKQ